MNPAEWRDHLVRRLDARWGQIKIYDAYYEGDQHLAYATQRFRDIYGGLFRDLADNWMALVVNASAERLKVEGFRYGNEDADTDAWAIWQANGLDFESNLVQTEAVKLGEAYWMIQPGDPPQITGEHPSQVYVETDPADHSQRLAAVKKWQGADGLIYCNVYLPDRIVKYRSARPPAIFEGVMSEAKRWNTVGATANPLGVVPIVPVLNNPSMLRGGRSDLAGGPITIQDAINKLLADMLIGSEYTAFRQRVLLGVDQPRDPTTGAPVPLEMTEEKAMQSRLWMIPGKDAKAFEFSANDLNNFRTAIEGLVRDLTAQTRTPPHYVSGLLVNVSGDALKAAETGLVSKVRGKMVAFGEAHEEAMRLAFLSLDPNDERAQTTDAETIWRDPESRSQAELADALTKLATIGVPREILWEKYGFSPQEIDRMKMMAEEEALLAPPETPPEDAGQPPQPPSN